VSCEKHYWFKKEFIGFGAHLLLKRLKTFGVNDAIWMKDVRGLLVIPQRGYMLSFFKELKM
jgi:hypothetical protein